MRSTQNHFLYLYDPLFLVCTSLYIIHEVVGFPFTHWLSNLANSYLNDFLFIPVALPIILYFLRKCNFRKFDNSPLFHEVLIPVAIWALVLEYIGPRFFSKGVPDLLDIYVYGISGIFCYFSWQDKRYIKVINKISRYRITPNENSARVSCVESKI